MGELTIEYDVKTFICDYWYYKLDKLKSETTLDDIGMFGDDKYDFIISFCEKFNLKSEDFPFDKYIDDEGGSFILRFFYKSKMRKIYPVSISMLIEWVEKGYWKGDLG